jgi:EAL domain-containing protein (putative c-di-GMP-specific phosphodiesterase class I)
MVVDMLAACLRRPGIHLTTCLEIEAAMALLSAFRFDVVVTDLSVSQLGGLEGMRLIRFVTTNFPDTAVYVLSGYVDENVRSLCSLLGVTAVLEKPEGLSQLRSLLLERRDAGNAGNTGNTGNTGDTANTSGSADTDLSDAAGGLALMPGEGNEVQQVELLEDFLATNTIRAVLQPIVTIVEGSAPFEVFGVEGLARGPANSVLGSPAFLLAYAARKELLFEADMICIRASLTQVVELGTPVTTFLNVQPRSLTNPEFTFRLCDEVHSAGLDERTIVLELTEQQTIVNPRAFASTLQKLRERGFRIALDDFGEGSSNLNLFQDLHPDFLKISGTFCRGLSQDPFKRIIVQSTAEMSRRAGTLTIMEAVETADDAEALRPLGIDYAQGYFFLKPLPGRDLAQVLRAGILHPPRMSPLPPFRTAASAS